MTEKTQNSCIVNDENSLVSQRKRKLNKRKEKVKSVYPNDFTPDTRVSDLRSKHLSKHDSRMVELCKKKIKVAGRIMLKRIMGKSSFITLQDGTGKIQLYLEQNALGSEIYSDFKQWDIGDIIGTEGALFLTKRGELSIRAQSIYLLCKALRPLPEKFHGLIDQELCYRERHLDLIMNLNTRQTFENRSKALDYIRKFMSNSGFIEVETPMLHAIPGGAMAKPFSTYHNAMNMEMFLRIAPELHLKRLIAGGFERVFELNRSFRNEGTSSNHNPEFTMMEFYAAYTNYSWMMDFTESLIRELTINSTGNSLLNYQGKTLDFSKSFNRLSISEAILTYSSIYKESQIQDISFLITELKKVKPDLSCFTENKFDERDLLKLQLLLFEESVSKKIWDPTYIVGYPIEVSPLARPFDQSQDIAERFELFIAGKEIANGFSELNDPIDQEKRFLSQIESRKNEGFSEKTDSYDSDYIRVLEYGLPPSGGCGIGFDRLIMLLNDKSNIRDVILFPHLRKKMPLSKK